MSIKNVFTDQEIKILKQVENDFISSGKTDIRCPRCDGNLRYSENGSSYSIECENKCLYFQYEEYSKNKTWNCGLLKILIDV